LSCRVTDTLPVSPAGLKPRQVRRPGLVRVPIRPTRVAAIGAVPVGAPAAHAAHTVAPRGQDAAGQERPGQQLGHEPLHHSLLGVGDDVQGTGDDRTVPRPTRPSASVYYLVFD